MVKLSGQTVPPPIDALDAANKDYVDTTGGGGGGTGVFSGALELVDIINVDSTADHVDFGATGDGLFKNALDGNVDETYVLLFNILNVGTGSSRNFRLWPNGATASPNAQSGTHSIAGNLNTWGNGNYADLVFIGATGRENLSGQLLIHAASSIAGASRYRGFESTRISVSDGSSLAAGTTNAYHSNGIWNDTTTNITSLRVQATDDATTTPAAVIGAGSQFLLFKVKKTGENSVSAGALEFLDEIDVEADTASITFGSGGDGAFNRALDGDSDEEYVISFYFPPNDGTAVQIDLRPNGITTNQAYARHFGGTSTGSSTGTGLPFTILQSIREVAGTFTLQAQTGIPRMGHSETSLFENPPGSRWHDKWAVHWNDTSTKITTLDIVTADASNSIKAGARIKLYRRVKHNLRADSADTYERFMSAAVEEGTNAAVEYTLGHSIYNGSLLGFSARLEDAVTAGSVTVRIKVDGTTKLTGVLDTSNPSAVRPAPYPIGVHKVAANQNISVEIETSGYTNAGSVTSAITVVAVLQNSAVLIRDPGGGRQHIKTIRVENGAVTSVTFNNLDGDVDGLYILEAEVNGSSDAGAIFVHPNGLTTNQFTRTTYVDGAPAEVTDTDLVLTSPNATGRWSSKTAKLHARTGKNRKWYCYGELGNSSGSESWFEVHNGWWADTSTNITSLVIEHETGSAHIGVGSEFRLYKLTEGEGQVEIV